MASKIGRLVGLVPTYREGPLAAGAIRSLLPYCDVVITAEGPIGEPHDDGEPTDLSEHRKNPRVVQYAGAWETEVAKRNGMLERTRRMPTPTWGIYLDADEIFIGAEYVRELIWAAEHHTNEGEDATAIPVPITEVDFSVGRVTRIIRLDRLERHVLSMSQLQFYDQAIVATFPLLPVWHPGEEIEALQRPPMQGEPHIHHRAYYRPPRRGEHRLHEQELSDFDKLIAEKFGGVHVSGHIPVLQDPGLIVARDTGGVTPEDPIEKYLRKG